MTMNGCKNELTRIDYDETYKVNNLVQLTSQALAS